MLEFPRHTRDARQNEKKLISVSWLQIQISLGALSSLSHQLSDMSVLELAQEVNSSFGLGIW